MIAFYKICRKWKWSRSVVSNIFATPRTVAYQASPSMGFSRQEYWSGMPFPSPEILPTQGSNPGLPHCRQTLYHLSHQASHIEAILKQNHKIRHVFLIVCKESLWFIGRAPILGMWLLCFHTVRLLNEEIDTHVCINEPVCCTSETHNILNQLYPNINYKLKIKKGRWYCPTYIWKPKWS